MTSSAVAAASWGRAKWKSSLGLAALPGPLMSPAGSLPDGGTGDLTGLAVEIFINSAWTDITDFVYYRGNVGVTITRGRADETSQIQPQTAKMILNNRDGRFSVRNPGGPYYGQLGRNTPLRVSRLANGIRRYRFHGEVPAWPTASDISGRDVTVTVIASGMLRRLRSGNQPLRSPLFRAFTIRYTNANYNITSQFAPVAYWPCEDGASATQIASGLNGGTAMLVSGSPKYATDTEFPGSAAIPQLNGSTWTGTVPAVSGATGNALWLLLSIPLAGDTNNSIIARMETPGGTVARLELSYTTDLAGSLILKGYDAAGTQVFTSGDFSFLPTINGIPCIIGIRLNPDPTIPGLIDWEVDLTSVVDTNNSGGFIGSFSGSSIGTPTRITINPGGGLIGTAVGHVACQAAADDVLEANLDAAIGWVGETPSSRIARLCGEQGVPAVVTSTPRAGDPGDETTMGTQTIDTFATLLQQVPDTLFTPLSEARDQLSLVLRDKSTMYNQEAKLTLDMAQNQLSGPLIPLDDDQLARNDVTVTRKGGSAYELAQTSGTMSTLPPPDGIGVYPYNYDLSLGDDSQLPDQVGWRLRSGTVDEPRYPRIPVNIRRFAGTSAASIDLTNALLTIDIGDRLDVINPPGPEFPPDPISQIVQGYTETLGNFEHDIVFNCSPVSPWNVAFSDDSVYGHADTDGSTLAGDYPLGTEATLIVATTGAATGSPLWTTDPTDFPFDINVGGERVTVTNITGAASPQTFTVTRSVNGVVKGQTNNTDVRLWQPMYLSM